MVTIFKSEKERRDYLKSLRKTESGLKEVIPEPYTAGNVKNNRSKNKTVTDTKNSKDKEAAADKNEEVAADDKAKD
ncbi:hypothetical protein ACYSNR_00940 [Enterococcus sp. LJL128]